MRIFPRHKTKGFFFCYSQFYEGCFFVGSFVAQTIGTSWYPYFPWSGAFIEEVVLVQIERKILIKLFNELLTLELFFMHCTLDCKKESLTFEMNKKNKTMKNDDFALCNTQKPYRKSFQTFLSLVSILIWVCIFIIRDLRS